jgi:hypothetical protein
MASAEKVTMSGSDIGLTNHDITVCLQGGAILGPFKATWSKDIVSDVRELTRDYDAFMQGAKQRRFKYHLHDQEQHVSHSLILDFTQVTAIYDKVDLHGES